MDVIDFEISFDPDEEEIIIAGLDYIYTELARELYKKYELDTMSVSIECGSEADMPFAEIHISLGQKTSFTMQSQDSTWFCIYYSANWRRTQSYVGSVRTSDIPRTIMQHLEKTNFLSKTEMTVKEIIE